MVLKPTEKTPLSALLLADVLYEAGLPPEMLSIVTGDPREIADEMLTNPDVDLVTFTGGVPIGKYIAAKAVYKRQVLELGGNDPIIVMEDADLDEAATLAATGSYKNSGQRCTAVKRMLVHEHVADAFVERLVAKTRAWTYGDPIDPKVDMGTVIDEAAAVQFEAKVNAAVQAGARLLVGNERHGALYSPTVLDHVRSGDGRGAHRDVRPGIAGDPLPRHRRCDPRCELDGLRVVVFCMHQPPRLHHALRERAQRRHASTSAKCPDTGSS